MTEFHACSSGRTAPAEAAHMRAKAAASTDAAPEAVGDEDVTP